MLINLIWVSRHCFRSFLRVWKTDIANSTPEKARYAAVQRRHEAPAQRAVMPCGLKFRKMLGHLNQPRKLQNCKSLGRYLCKYTCSRSARSGATMSLTPCILEQHWIKQGEFRAYQPGSLFRMESGTTTGDRSCLPSYFSYSSLTNIIERSLYLVLHRPRQVFQKI